MDRFDEIMELVLQLEGGYVNNPLDDGGPTNWGVTHTELAKWRGVSAVSPQEVKELGKEEAIAIFKDRYWAKIKGASFPQPIDLIVLDGSINHGVATMAKMLQTRVGVTADGKIGKATLAALLDRAANEAAVLELAIELAEDRKTRYSNHHDAKTFLNGWRNRLNKVMSVALKGTTVSWTFNNGKAVGESELAEDMPPTTMARPIIEDEDLQAMLSTLGLYKGAVDGLFGPQSAAALDAFLTAKSTAVSGDWVKWPLQRKKIAGGQLLCHDVGIDAGRIDGLVGPLTIEAFEQFNKMKLGIPIGQWRDELDELPASGKQTSKTVWPMEADVPNYYGDLGKKCTLVPLKRLELPYSMKLAWELTTTITGFRVHEKVYDSAARVFDAFYAHYGDSGVDDLGLNLFGGSTNCRLKTGSKTAWSMHAWSIAIDFDPARNQLKWDHKLARLAKPDAVKFWECWEAEGWVSLGRAKDYDWMHVQAARV